MLLNRIFFSLIEDESDRIGELSPVSNGYACVSTTIFKFFMSGLDIDVNSIKVHVYSFAT